MAEAWSPQGREHLAELQRQGQWTKPPILGFKDAEVHYLFNQIHDIYIYIFRLFVSQGIPLWLKIDLIFLDHMGSNLTYGKSPFLICKIICTWAMFINFPSLCSCRKPCECWQPKYAAAWRKLERSVAPGASCGFRSFYGRLLPIKNGMLTNTWSHPTADLRRTRDFGQTRVRNPPRCFMYDCE